MTKGSKGPISAEALMAEIAADPVAQQRIRERAEEARRAHEEFRRAEIPVVRDLCEAGFPLESLGDLFTAPIRPLPRRVLEILAHHLSVAHTERVLDAIARVMAVPEAAFAWETLVTQYVAHAPGRVAEGIASTLSRLAKDEASLAELCDLIRRPELGQSRVILMSALKKLPTSRARSLMEEFREDPELARGVEQFLGDLTKRERAAEKRRALRAAKKGE
jgi:hypothetical protein